MAAQVEAAKEEAVGVEVYKPQSLERLRLGAAVADRPRGRRREADDPLGSFAVWSARFSIYLSQAAGDQNGCKKPACLSVCVSVAA